MEYDSAPDTRKHIARVRELLDKVCQELVARGFVHDMSKLQSPEKERFDTYKPLLKDSTYGSVGYQQLLDSLGTVLAHHYVQNTHHPEHYDEGVRGMDLLDLLEMFCDWRATCERHADGDILKSIAHNARRFGYGPELESILVNTANRHFPMQGAGTRELDTLQAFLAQHNRAVLARQELADSMRREVVDGTQTPDDIANLLTNHVCGDCEMDCDMCPVNSLVEDLGNSVGAE